MSVSNNGSNEEMDISSAKDFIKSALNNIKNNSATKQLAMGSASGWLAGLVTMKIGKSIAFAVGGSIILLQIAQHQGYITINWHKVREKSEEAAIIAERKYCDEVCTWTSKIQNFARQNTLFAGGFLGGFFIGLAC